MKLLDDKECLARCRYISSAGVRSANLSSVVFTIARKSAVVGGDIVFLTINNYLKACCQNSHERVMKMQMKTSLHRIQICKTGFYKPVCLLVSV